MDRSRLIAVACTAVLAAGCAPPVAMSWEPEALRITMEPNAYRVHAVTLHALTAIDSLDLTVLPTFRSIVSVMPPALHGVAAGSSRAIRLAFFLPATAQPGRAIAARVVPGLPATIDVNPPTPEGTLESLRVALEDGNEPAYLVQFAPALIADQRRTWATFTDTARQALAQTVQTAERTALSGNTAEYRVTLLLSGQRAESSIVLRRGADGIWRVVRF